MVASLFAGSLVGLTPLPAAIAGPVCVPGATPQVCVDTANIQPVTVQIPACTTSIDNGPLTELPAPPSYDDCINSGPKVPAVDDKVTAQTENVYRTARAKGVSQVRDDCVQQWHYDELIKHHAHFTPGPNRQWDFINGGSRSNSMTATSSKEGEISMTASASIEVKTGVIISSVQATFGVSVTGTYRWSNTYSATANVPPQTVGHMQWGVNRFTTTGHYYHTGSNCRVDIDKGRVTVYSPRALAVKYWENRL